MHRAIFFAVAVAIPSGARPARAGGDDRLRLSARAIAEQGDALFYAGRCDKAMPLWLRADAVYHAPTIVLRIARCQALLGRVVAAAAALQSIVEAPLSADAPRAFASAREDAERELPGVRARIAWLRISVRPRGNTVPVTVEIDGSPSPAGPGGVPIDPGTHQVRVQAGGATWAREVHLDDGESRTLDVALWIEPLRAVPPLQRNAGLASFGVGVATLATGVGLSVSALSTARTLQAECGPDRTACPPSAQAAIDRTRAYSLAADAAIAGGAAFIVAGAVLLTADLHFGRESRVRLLASPRGAVLSGEL